MSSVPSNVAAHATATSAPDHPVWFHLMRTKSIGWLHSEFAQMLEVIDGFQPVLVAFHVVHMPQEFQPMDLIVAGWLIRKRPVPHIVQIFFVGAIVVGAIAVGVFFDLGGGLIGSSAGLRFGGVRIP